MAHNYENVTRQILGLTEGETDHIANMATIACELYQAFDHFHWVGFYRVVEKNLLKIGPYQGGHGCLTIPFSKGVCGQAARQQETTIVDDVNEFPGHIACSSSTMSEIVLPVFDRNGALIGVLDIDSDLPAAFSKADGAAIEKILHQVFCKTT